MAVKNSYHLFHRFSVATAMITVVVSSLLLLPGCKKDSPVEPPAIPLQTWHIGSPDSLAVTATLYADSLLVVSGTGDINFLGYNTPDLWHTNMSKLEIKNGVTSIGDYVFYECHKLTSVTIANSVTSIGLCSFLNCTELTSLTIPNSVTSIGMEAFDGCGKLSSVTIPNSVTSIGQLAFDGCGMTSITIPGSVKYIDRGAFAFCENLTAIHVDASNTAYSSVDGILYNKNQNALIACPDISQLIIPGSVTNIGEYAFAGCGKLTSVTIPNSVTSIGMGAFLSCPELTSITIPNSVTSIGDYAFNSCINLTSVTVLWDTPLTINAIVFSDVKLSAVTLRVPAGKITEYSTAAIWKDFGTIQPI